MSTSVENEYVKNPAAFTVQPTKPSTEESPKSQLVPIYQKFCNSINKNPMLKYALIALVVYIAYMAYKKYSVQKSSSSTSSTFVPSAPTAPLAPLPPLAPQPMSVQQ